MIEHNLVRATVTPEIITILRRYYDITEDEAMKRFYESNTAQCYTDEQTGLYGQSALNIVGLYIMEKNETIDLEKLDAISSDLYSAKKHSHKSA